MNKALEHWKELEKKNVEARAAGQEKVFFRKNGKYEEVPLEAVVAKTNKMREGINRSRAHRRTITDFC